MSARPHHRAERRRGLPKGLISAYLADQAKRKTLAPKLGTFEPPSRMKKRKMVGSANTKIGRKK